MGLRMELVVDDLAIGRRAFSSGFLSFLGLPVIPQLSLLVRSCVNVPPPPFRRICAVSIPTPLLGLGVVAEPGAQVDEVGNFGAVMSEYFELYSSALSVAAWLFFPCDDFFQLRLSFLRIDELVGGVSGVSSIGTFLDESSLLRDLLFTLGCAGIDIPTLFCSDDFVSPCADGPLEREVGM